ncbi:MAG: LytTR family DNA-binding domain-containing protein [Ferruginibacter sp.]
MNYILADDDDMYREVLLQQLSLIPDIHCVAACSTAVDAAQKLRETPVDLLILDVEMPGLTGVQLAKSLTSIPMLIFISSHPGYAVDAFELDAVDYLVKPASTERLMRAVDKARKLAELKASTPAGEGFRPDNDQSFFIKEKNTFIKIAYKDVLYIQSLGDFVNIFLVTGEKKIVLVSMKNIEQQLPAAIFLRISRTHIINKEKITAIETGMVMLDKLQLPVGKTYNDIVLKAVVGNAAVKRFI